MTAAVVLQPPRGQLVVGLEMLQMVHHHTESWDRVERVLHRVDHISKNPTRFPDLPQPHDLVLTPS